MEGLIRQAFLHIEAIGSHVLEGHYDLVGPNGDIILPQVWETVIEPDWTITMHMWPSSDKPKQPGALAAGPPKPLPAKKKADQSGVCQPYHWGLQPNFPSDGPFPDSSSVRLVRNAYFFFFSAAHKKRPRPADPGPFAMWMVGSGWKPNKPPPKKK